MTEVFFYHLQQQPLERVLPVLLERCLESGWKVVIQAGSDERVRALDDVLWSYSDNSFLPHGTEAEGKPETQPILLTASDINPNEAQVRVLVDGAEGPDLSAYTRAMVLFDGNDDEAVANERVRWKALKTAGHQIAYWQQDDSGRWVKRA